MNKEEALVTLYTSVECEDASQALKDFLLRGGFSFAECNISVSPEHFVELLERFGDVVVLPGVRCGKNHWIGADHPHMRDAIRTFCVDNMLRVSPTSPRVQATVSRNEISFVPYDNTSPLRQYSAQEIAGDFCDIQDFGSVVEEQRKRASSPVVHQQVTSRATSWPDTIVLPYGPDSSGHGSQNHQVGLTDLTRHLYHTVHHSTYEEDGRVYNYVTGHEIIPLLRQVMMNLGDCGPETCTKSAAVHFGQTLIERGILRSYTEVQQFERTFFALQPLYDTRVLNSFVQWPHHGALEEGLVAAAEEEEDPMDVMLRLSHQMDEICGALRDGNDITTAFESFEIAVCQLQHVPLPLGNAEHVAFAINLFNLIVRHAMILKLLKRNSGYSWPKELDQLNPFFAKVGYEVGGEWISAAKLQTSLFGLEDIGSNCSTPKRSGAHSAQQGTKSPSGSRKVNHLWNRLRTGRNNRRSSPPASPSTVDDETHFERPAICSDARILFALSWGTPTSPQVETIYPNRLKESLQCAAEAFCQAHVVTVSETRVILPQLLAWHARDFGGVRPADVLQRILPYLSTAQLKFMRAPSVSVAFAEDFDWTCGPLPVNSTELAPPTRAHLRDALVLGQQTSYRPSSPGSSQREMRASRGRRSSSLGGASKTQSAPPMANMLGSVPELHGVDDRSELLSLFWDEEDMDHEYDIFDNDTYFRADNNRVPEPPAFEASVSALTMGSEFF